MNILILGSNGQLGKALQKLCLKNEYNFKAFSKSEYSIIEAPERLISQLESFSPQMIINCAAYTKVDLAETEKEQANVINGSALMNVSMAANLTKAKLIHISTDFVFDGEKNTPYKEDDLTNPLSVYGNSKKWEKI